ncbi:MAG TPA: V-type ATPase 116kDa subunit family protein [Candidatus Bathyarchaeia archaeon]|nr:V-type ATPase 116kDa subunit family protein [Candidatus Bathyarchaeia archaeon]
MAIDKMKKVTVVCPVTCSHRLVNTLHGLGIVELTDALAQYEHPAATLKREEASTEDCDRELQKANLILGLLDVFVPVQQSFVQGLVNVPLIIEPRELDEALHKFDLEKHYIEASELDDIYRRAERARGDAQNQIKDLLRFENLSFRIGDLTKPKRWKLLYGQITPKSLHAMEADEKARQLLAWEPAAPGQAMRKNGSGTMPAARKGEPVRLIVACLKQDEPEARAMLASYSFEEVALPDLPGTVRDHMRELKEDLASLDTQIKEIQAKVKGMAHLRRTLQVLKAFWDNRRQLATARANTVNSQWAHLVTGYVREHDAARLEETIKREFTSASVILEDPVEGEDVPISLTVAPMVKPLRMLVNLFGLPPYKAFDPSPFLLVNFYIFFGICFSDVGYGLMLTALAIYIMTKTRAYEGVYVFAKLLLFAGVSTIIFGGLLGSFFGDLWQPKYLGEGNILLLLMENVKQLDPLERPLIALLLAIGIGILNQFYGIALKMYNALKNKDTATAMFDALLWLIILPGFVILIASAFVEVPPTVLKAGIGLFAVGAVGLVLTQGRSAKGLVGRFFGGLVSLYGIVGTYGLTAFIGDTMSYCRLLALGLTTSIVALSFNVMAGLLRETPYVGMLLFVLVLVVGHIFNFAISVLGAFVHSMRLIFVEFFGRFYEGGGRAFKPLSFDSAAAILKRPAQ